MDLKNCYVRLKRLDNTILSQIKGDGPKKCSIEQYAMHALDLLPLKRTRTKKVYKDFVCDDGDLPPESTNSNLVKTEDIELDSKLMTYNQFFTNPVLKCNVCGDVFNQIEFVNHFVNIHLKSGSSNCKICGESVDHISGECFNGHENTIIQINKPYVCPICQTLPDSGKSPTSFQRHTNYELLKKSKIYSTKTALRNHLTKVHGNVDTNLSANGNLNTNRPMDKDLEVCYTPRNNSMSVSNQTFISQKSQQDKFGLEKVFVIASDEIMRSETANHTPISLEESAVQPLEIRFMNDSNVFEANAPNHTGRKDLKSINNNDKCNEKSQDSGLHAKVAVVLDESYFHCRICKNESKNRSLLEILEQVDNKEEFLQECHDTFSFLKTPYSFIFKSMDELTIHTNKYHSKASVKAKASKIKSKHQNTHLPHDKYFQENSPLSICKDNNFTYDLYEQKRQQRICHVCGMTYFDKKALVRHVKRAHNIQSVVEPITSDTVLNNQYNANNGHVPTYQCPCIVLDNDMNNDNNTSNNATLFCEKQFEDENYLKLHIRNRHLAYYNKLVAFKDKYGPNAVSLIKQSTNIDLNVNIIDENNDYVENINGQSISGTFTNMGDHIILEPGEVLMEAHSIQKNRLFTNFSIGNQHQHETTSMCQPNEGDSITHIYGHDLGRESPLPTDPASASTALLARLTSQPNRTPYQYSSILSPAGPVGTFYCTACPEQFVDRHTLARHVRQYHEVEKSYVCKYCGKAYYQKPHLNRHLASAIHSDLLPHQCSYCGKRFARYAAMKKHVVDMFYHRDPTVLSAPKFLCHLCTPVEAFLPPGWDISSYIFDINRALLSAQHLKKKCDLSNRNNSNDFDNNDLATQNTSQGISAPTTTKNILRSEEAVSKAKDLGVLTHTVVSTRDAATQLIGLDPAHQSKGNLEHAISVTSLGDKKDNGFIQALANIPFESYFEPFVPIVPPSFEPSTVTKEGRPPPLRIVRFPNLKDLIVHYRRFHADFNPLTVDDGAEPVKITPEGYPSRPMARLLPPFMTYNINNDHTPNQNNIVQLNNTPQQILMTPSMGYIHINPDKHVTENERQLIVATSDDNYRPISVNGQQIIDGVINEKTSLYDQNTAPILYPYGPIGMLSTAHMIPKIVTTRKLPADLPDAFTFIHLCEFCGKTFTYSKTLKEHIKKMHDHQHHKLFFQGNQSNNINYDIKGDVLIGNEYRDNSYIKPENASITRNLFLNNSESYLASNNFPVDVSDQDNKSYMAHNHLITECIDGKNENSYIIYNYNIDGRFLPGENLGANLQQNSSIQQPISVLSENEQSKIDC